MIEYALHWWTREHATLEVNRSHKYSSSYSCRMQFHYLSDLLLQAQGIYEIWK